MRTVFVYGAFDDMRSRDIRFLQEASRKGPLKVLLWPDEAVERASGKPPKFGAQERRYFLEALRWVEYVVLAKPSLDPDKPDPEALLALRAASAASPASTASPSSLVRPLLWALRADSPLAAERPNAAKLAWRGALGIDGRTFDEEELSGFPYDPPPLSAPRAAGEKRVVVTGCYDWVHTGHVRFFEEAAEYGELNVVIGNDANVRFLKGEGHPLLSELERRYVVGSMRRVSRCLVSSGTGWLDAEPEIRELGAERYIVNEDGDKGGKRDYCARSGLEYIVLSRTPKEGLPRRASTDLRGY